MLRHRGSVSREAVACRGGRRIEPCDTGTSQVATINEGEAIDEAASDDEPPIHAMDDGSLLFVGVDGVIVDVASGGEVCVELMAALDALVADFLVGLVKHDGKWSNVL